MRSTSVLHQIRPLGLIALSALITSCGISGLDEIVGSGLEKVSLTGESTVAVGDTIRLQAYGTVSGIIGLLFFDPLRDARFSVSDPTVAAITPFIPPPGDTTSVASVLLKGLKVGSVQVGVRARGKSDAHPVQVTQSVPGP